MANFAKTLDWDAALDAVAKSKSVLLLAHVTPDADALGSALGLAHALLELGKSVQVSVGEEGFQTPESLNFLPGVNLIVSPENIVDPDLVISCDVSSENRLGTLAGVMKNAKQSIAIDHHPSFTGFGLIHLVDPNAAATAEIVLNFVDRLDVELNRDIASLIYAGLATDTGSFKYQATTSDTMRAAARLLDAGIDHSGLARMLFDDEQMTAITMMGEAIGRAQLDQAAANGAGLVYTSISIAQRGNQSELAMERVIESIRKATEAEVAAVFKQADDGNWKVSLRSKTSISVGDIALSLGGGGHRYAAGYTAGTLLGDAVDQLIAKLTEIAGN